METYAPPLLLNIRLSERNKPPPLLVPQSLRHTPQTLQESDSSNGSDFRMIPEHVGQPIAGNSTAKVMDVVHADVGRKPAQNTRQVVVRTALQRSIVKAPGLISGP